MKRMIIFCLLLLPMVAFAQNDRKHDAAAWREQMREQKKLVIISEMQLTETEKTAFLALYDQFESEQRNLHRSIHKLRKRVDGSYTEKQYEAVNEEIRVLTKKQCDLQDRFYIDMKKILSAEKIYRYYKAENKFNRSVFKDLHKAKK